MLKYTICVVILDINNYHIIVNGGWKMSFSNDDVLKISMEKEINSKIKEMGLKVKNIKVEIKKDMSVIIFLEQFKKDFKRPYNVV